MIDAQLRKRLEKHQRFAGEVRDYFSDRGYIEVDTPVLSPFLIPEPALEVFQTQLLGPSGQSRDLWLAPSPELWMKRLVGRGSGNIFQMSRSFRNGDFGSPVHTPEFRLLEWYTVGSGYLQAVDVTEGLFDRLLTAGPANGWSPRSELSPPFRRMTMREAFRRIAGIDLSRCQDVESMVSAGRAGGVRMPKQCTWEEAFHIVFLTSVEPSLPRDRPLVLLDYPALIPTTARRLSGTPWAERWELYVHGVEIANCYTEETDPLTLRELLRKEEERKTRCRVRHRIDTDMATAFPRGFPPVSGTALGVDRLEMVFFGEESLEGVIFSDVFGIVAGQSRTS